MTDPAAVSATAAHADGLGFRDLMAWTDEETRKWEAWLRERPEALEVSLGEGRWKTVGALIYHVFMVERRYAERLLDQPVTPYADETPTRLDDIFAHYPEARSRLERFVANARPAEWGEMLTFETILAGSFDASKRKIVAHALMHGIRHWAQIATALRQAGQGEQWLHDILTTSTME